MNTPSSCDSVTCCTVSTLPLPLIWYRAPDVSRFPFRDQVWIGIGSPMAVHVRTAAFPSVTTTDAKPGVMVGGAVGGVKQ